MRYRGRAGWRRSPSLPLPAATAHPLLSRLCRARGFCSTEMQSCPVGSWRGLQMNYRLGTALAGLASLASATWLVGAGMVTAQQPPPYTPPTEAVPPTGPADPNLRAIALP